MMNVKEYAIDTNHTVAEIVKKCSELKINLKNAEGELSEDDIIILDNAINLISTDTATTFEDDDELDDAAQNIVENNNLDKKYKPSKVDEKIKKKNEQAVKKADFLNKRKEMYKNKANLESNKQDEDVILFHDGMTVKDIADQIGCPVAQLITKLMANGLMVNMTMPVDFDSAAVVALDYHKTLKKDTTQDIANFEE